MFAPLLQSNVYGIAPPVTANVTDPLLSPHDASVAAATGTGAEPPLHTHDTEDEVFYVLEGEVTFHCGGHDFHVATGGTMVLPMGIEHG